MASIGNINRGIYLISKLAFWVDWKMADIISPLPECSKRKSGKSISVEEQQIILNVAKYFQEESKSGNKPQFRAGAVIAKTAAATGVGKNSVRKIVSICQYVRIYRNTLLLIMHLTIQKIRKITPLASGQSNNLLIDLQKRT